MGYFQCDGTVLLAKLLGNETSYDIKELYPLRYHLLKDENFFLAYDEVSLDGWYGGLPGSATSANVKLNVTAYPPSLSYDATTGILTITPGRLSANTEIGEGQGEGSSSGEHYGKITYKAYVIAGELD